MHIKLFGSWLCCLSWGTWLVRQCACGFVFKIFARQKQKSPELEQKMSLHPQKMKFSSFNVLSQTMAS